MVEPQTVFCVKWIGPRGIIWISSWVNHGIDSSIRRDTYYVQVRLSRKLISFECPKKWSSPFFKHHFWLLFIKNICSHIETCQPTLFTSYLFIYSINQTYWVILKKYEQFINTLIIINCYEENMLTAQSRDMAYWIECSYEMYWKVIL